MFSGSPAVARQRWVVLVVISGGWVARQRETVKKRDLYHRQIAQAAHGCPRVARRRFGVVRASVWSFARTAHTLTPRVTAGHARTSAGLTAMCAAWVCACDDSHPSKHRPAACCPLPRVPQRRVLAILADVARGDIRQPSGAHTRQAAADCDHAVTPLPPPATPTVTAIDHCSQPKPCMTARGTGPPRALRPATASLRPALHSLCHGRGQKVPLHKRRGRPQSATHGERTSTSDADGCERRGRWRKSAAG